MADPDGGQSQDVACHHIATGLEPTALGQQRERPVAERGARGEPAEDPDQDRDSMLFASDRGPGE